MPIWACSSCQTSRVRRTVNLSPADLPKEGSHYDLPIALGLLAAGVLIEHIGYAATALIYGGFRSAENASPLGRSRGHRWWSSSACGHVAAGVHGSPDGCTSRQVSRPHSLIVSLLEASSGHGARALANAPS